MNDLRFFDANSQPLYVGCALADGGTVTGFYEWDLDQRPSVLVQYGHCDGEPVIEVYPTRCMKVYWMDHDTNRICDDVEIALGHYDRSKVTS